MADVATTTFNYETRNFSDQRQRKREASNGIVDKMITEIAKQEPVHIRTQGVSRRGGRGLGLAFLVNCIREYWFQAKNGEKTKEIARQNDPHSTISDKTRAAIIVNFLFCPCPHVSCHLQCEEMDRRRRSILEETTTSQSISHQNCRSVSSVRTFFPA